MTPHTPTTHSENPSRREMLNYLLAGSVVMTGATFTGLLFWFQHPENHYKPGNPESVYSFTVIESLQADRPTYLRVGVFMSLTASGVVALRTRCPLRATILRWVSVNNRFECPWCGSKFELDGTYIAGPAERNMDHVEMRVFTDEQTLIADTVDPIQVDAEQINEIWVDTARIIRGHPREIG